MLKKDLALGLTQITLVVSLPIVSTAAIADNDPVKLPDCASILEDAARLSCYDKLFPPQSEKDKLATQAVRENPAIDVKTSTADKQDIPFKQSNLPLAMYWETDAKYKRGVFAFRPHNDNYFLLAKYSSVVNNSPFQATLTNLPSNERKLNNVEAAFQLSFKMKTLEDIPYTHSDLWFGYTQQSFWQAYSKRLSSPFRDTNYQPEVMLVTPLSWSLLGANIRFLNVGVVHQSNGRSTTLSRSWNRTYAQLGIETGKVETLFRVWKRWNEAASSDDNPDITNYMGHGDIVSTYRWDNQKLSLMLRRNFSTNRGATQLTWSFPVKEYLNGYINIFSGYGESLIDYNFYQRSIGIGFLVDY